MFRFKCALAERSPEGARDHTTGGGGAFGALTGVLSKGAEVGWGLMKGVEVRWGCF